MDYESDRPATDFRDLASILTIASGVIQPTPVDVWDDDQVGREYVEGWASAVLDYRLDVRGVLGYCAGATFACALGARLAAYGSSPAVILFDPQEISGPLIFDQFRRAVRQFGEFVNESELSDVMARARVLCDGPDQSQVIARLSKEYERAAEQALVEFGADGDIVRDLTERFAQYVRYLLASMQVGYTHSNEDVIILASAEHDVPPTLRGAVQRFPIGRPALLGSVEVAATVADIFRR